jgi:hypothetical protein
LDLAGAVGVGGEGPAEFVQDDVVVPPAVVLEVDQAGAAAVLAVGDVVGFAAAGGLVAAAQTVAATNPDRPRWLTIRVGDTRRSADYSDVAVVAERADAPGCDLRR